MNKQQGLKLFTVLLLSTLFIYSLSHFGALAYDAVTSDDDVFQAGTTIGSDDVSNQSKAQALTTVSEQLQKWQAETQINVQYKEKLLPVNLEIFQFDLQGSIDAAHSGQQNSVMASVQPEELQEWLLQLSANLALDETALTAVKNELALFGQNLKIGQHQLSINQITQTDVANETINKTTLSLDGASVAMMDWVKALSPINVPAQSQISFVQLLEEKKLTAMPAEAGSMIASGIYQTILPTNFEMIERHIGQELPNAVELGFEAKISQDNQLDFIFANPNDTEYTIELQWQHPVLTVELKGNPFLYTYEIVQSDKQEFKPKTIIQYSPQLFPSQTKVKEEGKTGYLVKITRKVYEENGKLLKEELISEDFYAPVEKIEVHGLKAGATNDSAPADTRDTDESSEEGQKTTDVETPSGEADETADNKDRELWGKPNETVK